MIEKCPICDGRLHMEEEKFGRRFTRVRRVVRCDSCRSILRQRGFNRWHYAVDPKPNPELYQLLNGQTFTEVELEALLEQLPSEPPAGAAPPPDAVIIEGQVEISPPLESAPAEAESLPEPEAAAQDEDESPAAEELPPEDESSPEDDEDMFEVPRFIEDDKLGDDFLRSGNEL